MNKELICFNCKDKIESRSQYKYSGKIFCYKCWNKLQSKPNFQIKEPKLCRIKIEENIINVETGKPLTLPLKQLNKDCNFRVVWNKFCGIDDEKRENMRESREKYNQKNKDKIKEYYQKYCKTPEFKLRSKEYYQRSDVKRKQREKYRKKYNVPESKWRYHEI